MKNPNKYGTVTKLSGNRRRPWIVREGQTGKQKPIGYTTTREEGLILLAQYNKQPWDIDTNKITLQQLYDLWLEKRITKLGISNQKVLKAAYNHCKIFANMRYNTIKSYQMQDCIDSCGLSYATQNAIKSLWGHLDKFAMELDIITKCYSDLLISSPIPETKKQIFTDDEIALLWQNQFTPWVDSILFLLYTGFRISEMLDLKIDNIDINAQTITGGTKTEAGKNRIVPIHSKILHIVQHRIEQSQNGYLFEHRGKKLTTYYRHFFNNIMSQFNMNHTVHECRHTFRSRLDTAGANKVCIDRMMGHKSADTGERIYTHKTIQELKTNIELITN